jgi:hypothetical protein
LSNTTSSQKGHFTPYSTNDRATKNTAQLKAPKKADLLAPKRNKNRMYNPQQLQLQKKLEKAAKMQASQSESLSAKKQSSHINSTTRQPQNSNNSTLKVSINLNDHKNSSILNDSASSSQHNFNLKDRLNTTDLDQKFKQRGKKGPRTKKAVSKMKP